MAAQTARIALIGFLDTKLNEYAYVSDLLERAGCQVLMIDVSTKVGPCYFLFAAQNGALCL